MNDIRGTRVFPVGQITAAWWAVPLRLVVGYGLIAHGYAKLSRGPSGFAAILQALDVPVSDVMAWATILVELVGGVAVLLGAFVWIASIPLAVVLLVAMFTVHLPYGFSSIKLVAVTAAGAQFGPPGYEANLLYLASLAALVLGGSGPLSVDGILGSRQRATRGGYLDRLWHCGRSAPKTNSAPSTRKRNVVGLAATVVLGLWRSFAQGPT